jgi:hypothetical protein
VSAGTPSTVTFDVSWDKADMPSFWLDSMWVFVDYNKNGKMTRMLITGGTLTEHSAIKAGTGIFIEENPMGAWVYGDARTNGSFSATVQLYTDEPTVAGACAYASSYPPLGNWIDDTKIAFSGTPMYEITLTPSGGGAAETVEAGSTFLLPCDYTMSSFTDATGAPGRLCLKPAIYTLLSSGTVICSGSGVAFALEETEPGVRYQLLRNNSAVSEVVIGDGGFGIFLDLFTEVGTYLFTEVGTYTAQTVADGVYCESLMDGVIAVTANPAVLPGEIVTATTSAMAGIDPNVTIESLTDATGGSGNITYQWRRTGTSSATLTGSAATCTIGSTADAGTYYFNRYAKDAACDWVAATGTYTLNLDMPITLCEECCWDGDAASTWVDCYVTTYAYPFDKAATHTRVGWNGYGYPNYYENATSDRNGRANTEAISTYTPVSAVGLCKALGPGWYLPAYEELLNMSRAEEKYSPLNGHPGKRLLETPFYFYWSSTEFSNNDGRVMVSNSTGFATIVETVGIMSGGDKQSSLYNVRCAWRPEIE